MEEKELRDLETIFAQVEDPHVERTKRHRLRDIIILAICGVICGAEGWVEIEEFGYLTDDQRAGDPGVLRCSLPDTFWQSVEALDGKLTERWTNFALKGGNLH